jgi:hypothetical protein
VGVIVSHHRGKRVRRLIFRLRENIELLGSLLKLSVMALKARTILELLYLLTRETYHKKGYGSYWFVLPKLGYIPTFGWKN